LDITVVAQEPKDSKLVAEVTVNAKDVDRAIAKVYKEIARRYNFQGFRRGHAPRPVIDSMVGKENVLADATSELLSQVEPHLINKLDVAPVGEIAINEEAAGTVEQGKDYTFEATVALRPVAELTSYDPVEIEMPPAEVTEAEMEDQIERVMSYQAHLEPVAEGEVSQKDDFITATVENIANADSVAGENRMLIVGNANYPEELNEALTGLKADDVVEATFKLPGSEEDAEPAQVKITVHSVQRRVTPELTEEFAKTFFGFDTLDEFREGIKKEIAASKEQQFPALKEERAINALEKRLELEEIDPAYVQEIFQELTQNFLQSLEQNGTTVDAFTRARGITTQQLIDDLQEQARENARQSIALDALARHLELTVDEAAIKEEIAAAGVEDVEATYKDFIENGRMPALRDSVLRSHADDWLVENAIVTEVDEVAKRRAEKDAE
jgi:trigger factor